MATHFDGHRIPFAVGPDGVPRSVDQVERGLACNCTCPLCKAPLIANKGERRLKVWHFSHRANTQCSGALESSLHLAVKAIFEKHKRLMIPPCIVYRFHPDHVFPLHHHLDMGELVQGFFKYTSHTSWHDAWLENGAGKGMHPNKQMLVDFDSVILEQAEGDVRPDIVGIANDRKLFIEVAVTHFIDKEKLTRLRERGTPTIELIVPFHESKGLDWEELKAWLFTRIDGKNWVLNTLVEKQAESDFEKRLPAFLKREERRKWEDQERVRQAKQKSARLEKWKAQIRAEEIARQKAIAEEKRARAVEEELAVKEREANWKLELEERKNEQLGLLMLEAYDDNKKWELVHAAETERINQLKHAYDRLAGRPSKDINPNGLPVIFLDYDSAIQPGSAQENARLQMLSHALEGILCSIVITSGIRQQLDSIELESKLAVLGGRHVSVDACARSGRFLRHAK